MNCGVQEQGTEPAHKQTEARPLLGRVAKLGQLRLETNGPRVSTHFSASKELAWQATVLEGGC